MYHFQKNIGDYRSATMHLTLLEHGVYNQLLDWYYLEERPLSKDNRTLFRRLSAHTDDEQKAVIDVLAEMFVETENGWIHKRVEREIAQYKAKSDQARSAGKLGGRPPKKGAVISENRDGYEKKADAKINKADAKPTANRKPLTNNQITTYPKPSDVEDVLWSSFISHRKKKKAAITEIAMSGILREADKAGYTLSDALTKIIERNWTGFEAEWVAEKNAKFSMTSLSKDEAFRRACV